MMQRVVLRAAAIGLLPMLSLFSHAQQKERIRGQQPEQVSSTGAPPPKVGRRPKLDTGAG